MARIDTTLPLKTTTGQPVELIETSARRDFPLVGYIGTSMDPTRWTRRGFFNLDETPHPNDLSNVPPEPQKAVRWVSWFGENLFQIDDERPSTDPTSSTRPILSIVKCRFVQGVFDD